MEKTLKENDTYESTGIVRGIDSLGRIVLPKELRTTLHLDGDTKLEIFVDGDASCSKSTARRQLRLLRRRGRQRHPVCRYCICPACRRKIGAL